MGDLGDLATALVAFQAEMPTVAKGKTATIKSDKGNYSYTYADLADVSAAAVPLLTKHGLSFVTLPGDGALTGMLLHTSGQSLTASLPIGGGSPQQIGSSLTYMRRYLLGCMTGLVTDDDDDGHLAQTYERAPEPPPDPLTMARTALVMAWSAKHGSTDVKAIEAAFVQWAAAPLLDADETQIRAFIAAVEAGLDG